MSILRRKDIDILEADMVFYSKRYDKTTTAPCGFRCDGATGVPDTREKCYRIHDWNFFAAMWDDLSPMTFEQANNNYTDLLRETGHPVLAQTRRALHWVGRDAWNAHRRREMDWQNTKIRAQFRADRCVGKNYTQKGK